MKKTQSFNVFTAFYGFGIESLVKFWMKVFLKIRTFAFIFVL